VTPRIGWNVRYELKCGLSQAFLELNAAKENTMAGLMIGELARQCGVAPSALRYYERSGLLAPPARASRRRQYDQAVLGRMRIILLARAAGFSISETRMFLSGFPVGTRPALRWREMAERKIAELDEQAKRLGEMRSILTASFHCECRELEDCERLMAAKTRCGAQSKSLKGGVLRRPPVGPRAKRKESG
jgi:MerR family redox-sensitive transcriptional activator SoxR